MDGQASDLPPPLFTRTEAKPDAVFTTHVPSVYIVILGGKPGSGAYTFGGLVAEKLEDLGYAVLQVSDRELRRPVIGCELCSTYDSLEPCINHLGATMTTSLYDMIQQAAIDVVKDPTFLPSIGCWDCHCARPLCNVRRRPP